VFRQAKEHGVAGTHGGALRSQSGQRLPQQAAGIIGNLGDFFFECAGEQSFFASRRPAEAGEQPQHTHDLFVLDAQAFRRR
jgi:hypothetical protein